MCGPNVVRVINAAGGWTCRNRGFQNRYYRQEEEYLDGHTQPEAGLGEVVNRDGYEMRPSDIARRKAFL